MGNADGRRAPTELDADEAARRAGNGSRRLGLSSGLIYVPGRYARTTELIELAKVAARHGGIYATHIRNEGAGLLEAIDEAIADGQGNGIPRAHLAL